MKFDRLNRLCSTNHGTDVRVSRPIANYPDEFHLILPDVVHRVSKINMQTGEVTDFAVNKSGFGVSPEDEPDNFYPGSGVIWTITKKQFTLLK